MSDMIDSIVLEVGVSSETDTGGLDAVVKVLKRLEKACSGTTKINEMVSSLRSVKNAANFSEESLISLERAIELLKKFRSITIPESIATNLDSLKASIRSMEGISFESVGNLSEAISPLTNSGKITSLMNQLKQIPTVIGQVNGTDTTTFRTKMTEITNALGISSTLGKSNLTTYINNLRKLPEALAGLSTIDVSKVAQSIRELVSALTPLSTMDKSKLGGYITQLSKLPQVLASLQSIDMNALSTRIREVAEAFVPLSSRIGTVSTGIGRLPYNINRFISASQRMQTTNNASTKSFVSMIGKLTISIALIRQLARAIAYCLNESNDYIENLNLFTASMGEYASEAKEYAEQVSSIVGIDPSEWMRNEGVFMTIIEGFGVASDRAYIMSKNLTQLGYDFSSFFNLPFDKSMQKLEAAISGELEPIRRLGVDLSEARLKAEAASLGITKSFDKMTQAEKAQLRYYAIMKQVTVAHGDMARTLNAPANQLRVLKAQLVQAARAIGNIFIPALNAVLPYLIAVTKLVREAAETIATMVGFELPEVDYSSIDDVASGTSDIADSLNEAESAAKKLKKHLISIDELNVISEDDSSSDLLDDAASQFDFELPTYDFLSDAVSSRVDDITKQIKQWLADMKLILAAAAFVLGAILVATGINIPLGLAMMAAGAAEIWQVAKINWDKMPEDLAKQLSGLCASLGAFALGLGVALVFTGVNIPVGLAMMAAGAAMLYQSEVIRWNFFKEDLAEALRILDVAVGAFVLAIGAVLVFSGVNIPVGLALMAAGAGKLIRGVAQYKGWSYPAEIETVLTNLEFMLGGFSLAIGAVMAFSGMNIPLGILLMISGIALVASEGALNWDSLKNDITKAAQAIESVVAGFELGLGAILVFSGINVPVGVALMLIGISKLGIETVKILWGDAISSNIKECLNKLEADLSVATLVLGGVLLFSGTSIPLGLGLLLAGAVGLAGEVYANWSTITSTIGNTVNWIEGLLGAAMLTLGAILTFSGANIPLGIGLLLAGATMVAVSFNPLWDSMPEQVRMTIETIEGLLCVAFLVVGALLLFSGVAIPLGIALLVAGASIMATAVATNWDSMVSQIKTTLKDIHTPLAAASLVLGAIMCFTGVMLPLGIALLCAGAADLIATLVTLDWSYVKDTVEKVLDELTNWLKRFAKLALGVILCLTGVGIPMGVNLIKEAMSSTEETKPDWDGFANKVASTCKRVIGSSQELVDHLDADKETQAKCWQVMTKNAGIYLGSGSQGLTGVVTKAGKNVPEGIDKGVKETSSKAVEAVKSVAEKISEKFKSQLGINSPSKVFSGYGNNICEGLKEGISNNQNLVISIIKSLGSSMLEGFKGKINDFKAAGSSIVEKVKTGFDSVKNNCVTTIKQWANNLAESFHSSIKNSNGFSNAAISASNGFSNSINSNGNTSSVKNWATNIVNTFKNNCHYNTFWNAAVDVINGFNSSLQAGYTSSKNFVLNWADSIISNMKNALNINSPSKEFRWIGDQTISGFNQGIEEGMGHTTDVMQEWAASIVDGFAPEVSLEMNKAALRKARNGLAGSVETSVTGTTKVVNDGFEEGLESLWETKMRPLLSQMADDMRKQADKDERPIVELNGRKLNKELTRQRRSEGYSFSG